MRLWHQSLIPYLPRQQLLGQHRECCALRGNGWGKNYSVVNYVFTYAPEMLVAYHYMVMDEMKNRGYNPDETWYNGNWRGSTLQEEKGWTEKNLILNAYNHSISCGMPLFIEHDNDYLQECLENLKSKGIDINFN